MSEVNTPEKEAQAPKIAFHIAVANKAIEDLANSSSVLQQDPSSNPAFAPYNPLKGNHMTDINQLILAQEAHDKGFEDPRWLTYKQAEKLGATVKRNQKATLVQYVSWIDKDGKTLDRPMYSTYPVFNASQIANLPAVGEMKSPQVTNDSDKTLLKETLNRTVPNEFSQQIGSWMAAARTGINLPDSHKINSDELKEHLHTNPHSQLFRLARQGSNQVESLNKTVEATKEKIFANYLGTQEAGTEKAPAEAKKASTAKKAPKKSAAPKTTAKKARGASKAVGRER